MDVSQALDLLKIEGDQRRQLRVEWQRRGLIDEKNRVDLEALAPSATRGAPPAAAARAKPKPAAPTAAQRAARAEQLEERRLDAEHRAFVVERAIAAMERRYGVFRG